MGCGKCGKARQGPSCLPLLGKRLEAVPAKALPPQNALPVCSRWWRQRSRGTGGAGQVFSTASSGGGQSRASLLQLLLRVRAPATSCRPGAVTLDAASQLWSHLTTRNWSSSSVDVCDDQESVCNPSILLPPFPSASLPGVTAWCILSEAVSG